MLSLIATEECIYQKSEIDPLEFWRENKHIYPNEAKCARMWLSAPATSTPSERVFSICGIVDTARQNRSDCSMTVVRNTFCSHDC